MQAKPGGLAQGVNHYVSYVICWARVLDIPVSAPLCLYRANIRQSQNILFAKTRDQLLLRNFTAIQRFWCSRVLQKGRSLGIDGREKQVFSQSRASYVLYELTNAR